MTFEVTEAQVQKFFADELEPFMESYTSARVREKPVETILFMAVTCDRLDDPQSRERVLGNLISYIVLYYIHFRDNQKLEWKLEDLRSAINLYIPQTDTYAGREAKKIQLREIIQFASDQLKDIELINDKPQA